MHRLIRTAAISSRPPSSDLHRKGAAFPRTKGGKIGGKKGHDGGTLKMVDKADHIVEHQASVCTHCGKVHFQERLVYSGPPPGFLIFRRHG